MKPGSTPPPPPDDEAADPLLAALQQRLGDYGQTPPPGAWAAIRQRVAPPPQPWWRRPRRLLPLLGALMGLLLPGLLTEQPLKLAERPSSSALASRLSSKQSDRYNFAEDQSVGHAGRLVAHATTAAPQPTRSASGVEKALQESTVVASTAPATHLDILTRRASKTTTTATTPFKTGAASRNNTATKSAAGLPAGLIANKKRLAHLPTKLAANPTSSQQTQANEAVSYQESFGYKGKHSRASSKSLAALAGASKAQHLQQPILPATAISLAANRAHTYVAAPQVASSTHTNSHSPLAAHKRPGQPTSTAVGVTAHESITTGSIALATGYNTSLAGSSLALGSVGLLALKPTNLLLPPVALPTLAAHPDSSKPRQLARRWSLLVVAGPTLSYRTLGPAPLLVAGRPDFARLERPALGLGAQVQVRRVLSGRWALAVGLGYHEYATQLALSLRDTASVHQRDTYRLLTVPVQLSYALGAPKGRLTKGLLLGIEPGWYLGGRSTEGADCGCHQQTYLATGSPYRNWSLALSLGLDLRYRLGSADSRWQWLVQPTGRYVATPFVRSDAVGFTQRQPWSLGLLTGFSWDVR